MQEVQLSSGVEPPLRFSAPRTAAVRECFVRSTVSVGGGRSLEALGALARHHAKAHNSNDGSSSRSLAQRLWPAAACGFLSRHTAAAHQHAFTKRGD